MSSVRVVGLNDRLFLESSEQALPYSLQFINSKPSNAHFTDEFGYTKDMTIIQKSITPQPRKKLRKKRRSPKITKRTNKLKNIKHLSVQPSKKKAGILSKSSKTPTPLPKIKQNFSASSSVAKPLQASKAPKSQVSRLDDQSQYLKKSPLRDSNSSPLRVNFDANLPRGRKGNTKEQIVKVMKTESLDTSQLSHAMSDQRAVKASIRPRLSSKSPTSDREHDNSLRHKRSATTVPTRLIRNKQLAEADYEEVEEEAKEKLQKPKFKSKVKERPPKSSMSMSESSHRIQPPIKSDSQKAKAIAIQHIQSSEVSIAPKLDIREELNHEGKKKSAAKSLHIKGYLGDHDDRSRNTSRDDGSKPIKEAHDTPRSQIFIRKDDSKKQPNRPEISSSNSSIRPSIAETLENKPIKAPKATTLISSSSDLDVDMIPTKARKRPEVLKDLERLPLSTASSVDRLPSKLKRKMSPKPLTKAEGQGQDPDDFHDSTTESHAKVLRQVCHYEVSAKGLDKALKNIRQVLKLKAQRRRLIDSDVDTEDISSLKTTRRLQEPIMKVVKRSDVPKLPALTSTYLGEYTFFMC